MSEKKELVDWVNLPATTVVVSLWDTLHDGDLLAANSDLSARTVRLRFDVHYQRDFHELSEGSRFEIMLSGVQSARAVRWAKWPGEFAIPTGTPQEEQSKLIQEYQAKWREESYSWTDFENSIAEGIEVMEAVVAHGIGTVAVKLGLMTGDERYTEVFLRAEGARFSVGQEELTLEEFAAFGEPYWEEFAKAKGD